MKLRFKGVALFLIGLLLLSAAACTPTTLETTPGTTDQPSSGSPTEVPVTQEPVIEQENPYEWLDEYDAGKEKGYANLAMVGVDDYGRVVAPATAEKEDKAVGIFYLLLYGTFPPEKIYDVEKIIAQHGTDAVFKEDSAISPNGQEHYWGEPLYGYYNSVDTYVIRKHLEQFTAAGVDYIVLDVTNGFIYNDAAKKLQRTIIDLREQGWDAPQIVYYVHSLNNKTVRELYSDIYSNKQFEEAWYKRDGKPVIIAYTDTEKDKAEASTRGVTDFSDGTYAPLSQEILDFFYFVEPRWPSDSMYWLSHLPFYDPDKKTGFCWIEWTYPVPERTTSLGTFCNVAVASHPSIPFSASITRGSVNWSRGYDPGTKKETEEGNYTGTYFQSCWDRALKLDSDNVFLVGWNCWTSLKQPFDDEYMLCDTATFKYSLSIEMSREFYKDAYYMQMMSNMRKYKYEAGEQPVYKQRTIDINGSYAQWYNNEAVYRQIGENAYNRNSRSADSKGSYRYRIDKPANNVQEVRVAHDSSNLYFMIRCEEAITEQNGANNWMNLFIGSGTPSLKDWNSYEYVLNRSVNGGKSDVVKLNSDFTGETVGSADIVVRDNFMFLSVPRSAVGLSETDTFYFKVADSVAVPEDIMEYYVSGSVFPIGRLSYTYTGV